MASQNRNLMGQFLQRLNPLLILAKFSTNLLKCNVDSMKKLSERSNRSESFPVHNTWMLFD